MRGPAQCTKWVAQTSVPNCVYQNLIHSNSYSCSLNAADRPQHWPLTCVWGHKHCTWHICRYWYFVQGDFLEVPVSMSALAIPWKNSCVFLFFYEHFVARTVFVSAVLIHINLPRDVFVCFIFVLTCCCQDSLFRLPLSMSTCWGMFMQYHVHMDPTQCQIGTLDSPGRGAL